jgi:plasmid maintenance system antidote protein VapI
MLRNGVPPEVPEGFDKIQHINPEQDVKSTSSKHSVSSSEYKKFLAWQENQSVSGKSKSSHLSLTSQAALAAKDKEMEERLAAKDKEIAKQLAAKDEEMKEFLREKEEQIKATLALQLQAAFDAEKKRLEYDLQQEKARLQQESAQKA